MPPRTSAADQVYRTLKSRILEDSLPAGKLLGENEVATGLGVSRTPVREAFTRLQAEGWLTLYPQRGALVREAGPDEVRNVVRARLMIESQAVRDVVAAGRQEELAEQLEHVLARQEEAVGAVRRQDAVEADAAFHQHLVAAAGNPLVTDFFGTLKDRQHRMSARSLWTEAGTARRALAHHRELVDLIRSGDDAGFTRALEDHLSTVHRDILPPAG